MKYIVMQLNVNGQTRKVKECKTELEAIKLANNLKNAAWYQRKESLKIAA